MGDINQDPSMEEILASIKRVIAEDGRSAAVSPRHRSARAESPPEEPAAEDDVLELNDPVSDEDRIMSDDAATASRAALAALAAMSSDEPAEHAPAAASEGPLEAVVRDMLRPMLKDWLDQRLPEMVEELVTREIARITGKSFR